MALSQCLDDSPLKWYSKRGTDMNTQELYNEKHRLALEELVSGGIDNFLDFLRKERIHNFLSDDEIKRIVHFASVPRYSSIHGEDMCEPSVSSSMDCSSVTYFPEISDVEPPQLEIGWPAFTTGSFRGVTRAVAHFQPSYGECIYSCKEAVRRMIKSAREVIAIVTDSLTDLDIFKDLQEACNQRHVPVYILLEHTSAPAFLKMCTNLGVCLDELKHMRVRTITGGTYYMRSGAKITGKVHERFMLVDGNRVATGSYRFNWTDGKLNSSNLIELSGQVTENFDEEFRILYAQSLPISARCSSSARNSGIFGQLLNKNPITFSPQPSRDGRPIQAVCVTSTPSRKPQAQAPEEQPPPCETLPMEASGMNKPVSDPSTLEEDWDQRQEEILAGSGVQCSAPSASVSEEALVKSPTSTCHISTQTSFCSTMAAEAQTEAKSFPQPKEPQCSTSSPTSNTNILHCTSSSTQDQATTSSSSSPPPPSSSSSSPSSSTPSSGSSTNTPRKRPNNHLRPPARHSSAENNLRDCFHKLTKERQHHYSNIRSKLEHMVTILSQRKELVDVTNTAAGPGTHRGRRAQRECGLGPESNTGLLVESAAMGTWPRARCLL